MTYSQEFLPSALKGRRAHSAFRVSPAFPPSPHGGATLSKYSSTSNG